MTNETMLTNVYAMLDEAIRFMQFDTSEEEANAREALLDPDFTFGKVITTLKEDITKDCARKSGKSKQLAAVKRIIKSAERDEFKGAWIGHDGKQYICSGYHGVALNEPFDLPEVEPRESLEKAIIIPECNWKDELDVPSIADVKSLISQHEAIHGKKCESRKGARCHEFHNGDIVHYVSPWLLLDMLETLPDCKIYATGDDLSALAVVAESGCGVLLPVNRRDKNTN